MSSTKFLESIEIVGDWEVIFDYTQDYKNRLKWDTFLVEAHLLDNATDLKGRWCGVLVSTIAAVLTTTDILKVIERERCVRTGGSSVK